MDAESAAGRSNTAHSERRATARLKLIMRTDPYNLQRFVAAQDTIYEQVLAELRAGRKTSHWMWFVFPQIQGLGHSPIAKEFALSSREEAEAYLKHPILGPRLRECTALVNQVEGESIEEIFGHVDSLKFRSSMTLFAQAASDNQVFLGALQKYYAGKFDPLTMQQL
jgi:uncharacterized protein (DUF1810 family)